ncbi:MAG: prolipoprotein diacylglyceryl transferase [Terriglobales bacterium]
MRRVLFRWRGLTVWSYPAMLYLGLVFGVAAGNIAAHAAGLDGLRVYIATIVLIVPALIGARLLFVASEWKIYRRNPRRIWDRSEGGFMMYGAVPVMLLFSVPLLRALHVNFGAFWDVSTFTILVGMIFTRLGCLLNGCCGGRPTSGWFGIHLPNTQGMWQKRVPTQMLEAACAAVLLVVAIVMWRRTPFPGALFLLIMLSYSSVRLVLELARERVGHGRQFRIAYALSVIFVLGSISALALNWR